MPGPSWQTAAMPHPPRPPGAPPPRAIREWIDAEHNAAAWMKYLGHPTATVTPGGADGGVDVRAKDALAQVKMRVGRVSRPDVQRLVGAAGRNSGQALYFFSFGGYTADALVYARQSEIAAFTILLDGDVTAQTPAAVQALKQARDRNAPKRPPAPPKNARSAVGGGSPREQVQHPHWKAVRKKEEKAKRQAAAAAARETQKRQRDVERTLRSERPAPKPEDLPVVTSAFLAAIVLGLSAWVLYATVSGLLREGPNVLRVLGSVAGLFLLILGCVAVSMTVDARRAKRAARRAKRAARRQQGTRPGRS